MRVKTFVAAAVFVGIISPNAEAFTYNPFDFSPLGQFRAGFYGSVGFSAVRGLDSFVQGRLSSYAQSGRQFGFYPQAYNNSAYFQALNFYSGGLFLR